MISLLLVVTTLLANDQLLAAPASSLAEASTDTTVAVGPLTRLRIESSAGRITIRVWDQSSVRVVATSRPGTTVHVEASDALVNVWASASGRIADAVYVVTVPRKMGLSLGSGDVAIDIAGSEGDIVAKNYSGNITVAGGRGSVSLKSVLGEVSVRGAKGRITAQSMNAAVRLTDVTGDVDVESSVNHLYLTQVDSRALTASSVGGVIWFSGPLHDDGHYAFTTHSGSILLSAPEPVNATVSVSTVSGAFSSVFPSTRQQGERAGRFTVKVGTGAATVDVETFAGGIVLKRPDSKDKSPQ